MTGNRHDERNPSLAIECPHALVEPARKQHLAIHVEDLLIGEAECLVVAYVVDLEHSLLLLRPAQSPMAVQCPDPFDPLLGHVDGGAVRVDPVLVRGFEHVGHGDLDVVDGRRGATES